MADRDPFGAWNGILPPDFQRRMDDAEMRRQLALAMAAANRQQTQGQMVSGYYVKPHATQYLANALGQGLGAYEQMKMGQERSQVLRDYQQAGQEDLAKVMAKIQPKEIQGPPMEGQQMGYTPPDYAAAETEAASSQFPNTRALARVIAERRKFEAEQENKERENRTRVFTGAAPSSTPESVAAAAQAGGDPTKLQGLGEWKIIHRETAPNGGEQVVYSNGRDVRIGSLPAPSRVMNVNNASPDEDKYLKAFQEAQAKKDSDAIESGKTAAVELKTVERFKTFYRTAAGNFTGGPLGDKVQLFRELALQAGVKVDPKDINNATLQAEAFGWLADKILAGGRGITDEDAKALRASFPGNKITPQQFPAFVNQLEARLRGKADAGAQRLAPIQERYGQQMPATTQGIQIPESSGPLELQESPGEPSVVRRRPW